MPDTTTKPENNTMDIQKVWNFDLGTLIRREELNGRQYIVVPMVMILEGVHVGSQGPVYYSLDELAKTPKQWNMKPIVIEHPFRGDTATDLEVYKKQAVGMIMNTHFVDGKLKAEAWIDEQLAQEKCPELIQHIEHRLPMEVSTGLFSELVMEPGTWNGEEYKGKIINIRADHLAILPKKQGACSLSDGAGLLINQSYANDNTDSNTNGDTLNIISTVINQTFPPGSNVVMDYDLDVETGKKQPEEVLKEKQDKETQDKEKEEKKKEKIENAIKPEVFMTADGNKITYEAAGNGTLEIEKPDFGSADEKKEEPKEVKVEPIQDNPVNVEATPKIGRSEFEELLANLAVKAERVRSFQEQHNMKVKNKQSFFNAQYDIQSTKDTFKFLTRDKLEWTGELKSLTDSLTTIEAGLMEMYGSLREYLLMVGIDEEDIPFNLTGFKKFLDYIVRYKNALNKPGLNPENQDSVFTDLDNYLSGLTDEELDEMYAFVERLYNCEKGVVMDSVELMQFLMSNQTARTVEKHEEYEGERVDLKHARRGSDNNKSGIPEEVARNPMLGTALMSMYDDEKLPGKTFKSVTKGMSPQEVKSLDGRLPESVLSKVAQGMSDKEVEDIKDSYEYPMKVKDIQKSDDDERNFRRFVRDLLGAASAVCKGIIFAEDDLLAAYWSALEDIVDTYGLDEYAPRLRVMLDLYRDKAMDAMKKTNQ